MGRGTTTVKKCGVIMINISTLFIFYIRWNSLCVKINRVTGLAFNPRQSLLCNKINVTHRHTGKIFIILKNGYPGYF